MMFSNYPVYQWSQKDVEFGQIINKLCYRVIKYKRLNGINTDLVGFTFQNFNLYHNLDKKQMCKVSYPFYSCHNYVFL